MSSPGAPPAAPTPEASKCAWIIARAVASSIENLLGRLGETPAARVVGGLPQVAGERSIADYADVPRVWRVRGDRDGQVGDPARAGVVELDQLLGGERAAEA